MQPSELTSMTQDMLPDIIDSLRGELLASVQASFPRLSLTHQDMVLERCRRADGHLTTPLPQRIAPALALSAPEAAQRLLDHFHHDERLVKTPFIDPHDTSGCIHFCLSTPFISATIFALSQRLRTPSPPAHTLPTIVTTLSSNHASAPGSLRAAFAADALAQMLSAAHHTHCHHHLIVLNATSPTPALQSLEQHGILFDTHQAIAPSRSTPQPPHQQLCTSYLHHLKQLSASASLIVYHASSLSGLYPLIKHGAEAVGLVRPQITLRAPVQSGSWNFSPCTNHTHHQQQLRTIRFSCIDTTDTTRINLELTVPQHSPAAKAFHHILTQHHNAQALLDAAATRGVNPQERLSDTALSALCAEERALAVQLCMVYEAYSQAQRTLSCRPLSRYLVQLSTAFEMMYMQCPVFGDNPLQSGIRIALCKAFAETVSALLRRIGL